MICKNRFDSNEYWHLLKLVTALDKEMRTWDTYVQLEAAVKNMLTSLRAVGELQNPAIRERHWQQLMKSTKVSIHTLVTFMYLVIINSKAESCRSWLLLNKIPDIWIVYDTIM